MSAAAEAEVPPSPGAPASPVDLPWIERGREAASPVALGPAFGEFGGVSQHVRSLAEASALAPDVFRIPAWSGFHPAWSRGMWWVEAARFRAPDPWLLWLARKLEAYGVVHLHAFPYWVNAYLRRRNPDARYVYTVHQVFERDHVPERQWPRFRALNQNLFDACRTMDVVVSPSTFQARILEDHGIAPRVIPNGVHLGGVTGGDGDAFRARHGLDGDFALSPISALPVKRPDLLAGLARSVPDVTFVACGRGMTETSLTRYLRRSPPSNLRLLGTLPRPELVDAYAGCRCLVLPSEWESFSLVTVEALANGRPAVVAAGIGASEIVRDGVEGHHFPRGDASGLAAAFRRTWESAPRMADAARRRADEYAWPRVAGQLDAVYRNLLE